MHEPGERPGGEEQARGEGVEQEPVQLTPWVERTTLSCAQRSRQKPSQAGSPVPNTAHPSAETSRRVSRRRAAGGQPSMARRRAGRALSSFSMDPDAMRATGRPTVGRTALSGSRPAVVRGPSAHAVPAG
ncbi:hypothetical protein ABZT17_41560 [Streptomyces sp. NPDC005648]|uniref:hypothetical protein n=1 Tax=Streptomyces sp. NPDC005648 TaxID=3157044 RepID=UPI0033A74D4B